MSNDPNFTFIFYRGAGPLAWLIRSLTEDPMQPLGAVPGHVGVAVGDAYFEAVLPRVRTGAVADALTRPDVLGTISIPVSPLAQAKALAWLHDQAGKPYALSAIIQDAGARIAPWAVSKWSREFTLRAGTWTCSTLALAAARQAGIALEETPYPIDPNGLAVSARYWLDYAGRATPAK